MAQQYLTLWDWLLTPLYLIVLTVIAKVIRDKKYPVGHPLRPYYLPGLLVKFGGAIFIALIYQYYYGGGDTFNYYNFGKIVNSSFSKSFETWLDLILRVSPEKNPYVYPYSSQIEFYNDPASYMIVRLSAVFGLLTFNSYLPSALLFAFISYSGIWAMYRTFAAIYPKLVKPLAFAFLFVPSVFVWGSAIFKDTICMFGLGWMTYTGFRIFIDRDLRLTNLLLFAFSFYLVGTIKVYILMAFVPSILLWLMLTHSSKIKSIALRTVVVLGVGGVVVVAFFFFSSVFAKELNRYSLDKLTQTVQDTRGWIMYASGDEGSAYDLGDIDPNNPASLFLKLPAAVTVTLFRPFLWEVRKPIMLLSALEGLAFLGGLLWVFFRNGLLKTFSLIFKSPNLSFFFVYSVIFAFAVGISSGNFGALSRYKIPCMPFFAAFLVILLYDHKKNGPLQATQRKKTTYAPPLQAGN